MKFTLFSEDGRARRGAYTTANGVFQTPAFMPVGTQGTVKGLTPRALAECGAEIILTNTYHLHLRPGEEIVQELGGIHTFMGWPGPILSDSGGYQVFSLSKLRKVDDEGIAFQSHIDGKKIFLTPENVVQIQSRLGVDIAMMLDECVRYNAPMSEVEEALRRTTLYAQRSIRAPRESRTSLFGIIQGGMNPDLRKRAVNEICSLGFDGYSIGGLSVGEPSEIMYDIGAQTAECMPKDHIRYLMGVGTPSDIVHAVGFGIDLFDCVIPTRSARFGRVYVRSGVLNIRNTEHRRDRSPLDERCSCYTCRTFSRAYLAHLVHSKEVLAVELLSLHNIFFYQQMMKDIRNAIAQGEFSTFSRDFLAEREDGAVEVPPPEGDT